MRNLIAEAIDIIEKKKKDAQGEKCDHESPEGLTREGDKYFKSKSYGAARKYYTLAINKIKEKPISLLFIKRALVTIELARALQKSNLKHDKINKFYYASIEDSD